MLFSINSILFSRSQKYFSLGLIIDLISLRQSESSCSSLATCRRSGTIYVLSRYARTAERKREETVILCCLAASEILPCSPFSFLKFIVYSGLLLLCFCL